jgi:tetratricopeptide (TPR) repeat protein
VAFSILLTGVLAGSAHGQVTASEAASVREHVNKGNYQMGRGAWDQAIAEYEAALDVDAGSMVAKDNLVLVHNNWGISLFRQHKFEEAKGQWEEALKMNPYDRNAKQNLIVLKSTMARINAAPKPPVKPAAEPKEASETKASGSPENSKEEPTSSGVKMLNNQPKPEAIPSGPKMLNSAKEEPPSSGIKLLNHPKKETTEPKAATEDSGSAAVVIMNAGHRTEESHTPSMPAPPAVQSTAPEPPQVSSPPPMDMNSPYSFVDTPTSAKLGAEASSPYGMPSNLSTTVRQKPYIAPPAPAPPPKPSNEWMVPVTVSPEATANTPTESDSSGNLEDQLGAIEMKLNGKKQKNMPLLKRIEKLETSISGQAKSGTLQERIDTLRKSCGL